MQPIAHGPLSALVADVTRLFGTRLEAVVAYGRDRRGGQHSLVLVSSLTVDDLNALALASPRWRDAGIATPLVMPRDEFARSLDAFPLEYGEIIDTHTVLAGADPFEGMQVAREDVRRAVEVRLTSHLVHLRENFIEGGGRLKAVDAVVRAAAPEFAALLRRVARLHDQAPADDRALASWAHTQLGLDVRTVGDILALASDDAAPVEGVRLYPDYLAVATRLRELIDQWSPAH
ncbi:MAG: hypothetical protein FJW29_06640 [Acidobacteria bacterium]|nr:hypothetical protein [Acidobacteriota bacterium]